MRKIENIIRVIENQNELFKTKILCLYFESKDHLDTLFTPKLENISFIKFEDNSITINLKNDDFREYFNDWIDRFYNKLVQSTSYIEIITKFNLEIKAIILLGKKQKQLSWETARGLFGEFLVLKKYLINTQYLQKEVLESWHRPSPANHDFDFSDLSIEVKTISKDSTRLKISSEYQLEATSNKKLYLQCFRIENIENSRNDSLGILYNEIKDRLDMPSRNIFEIKCAEDIFCEYLGPDLMPLNFKFNVIEEYVFNVDQLKFPRIKKNELHPAISKCLYNIDISALEPFKLL
jgi:hypothetical protein